MKIIIYNTYLNEDGAPMLVKESSHYYPSINGVSDPLSIVEAMNTIFRHGWQTEEYMYLMCLTCTNKIIGIFELSHGSLMEQVLHPREIFKKAMLCNAAQIVLTHNHPSGEAMCSNADLTMAKTVAECGKLLKIPLTDHIIIARNNYFSFATEKLI